jgi:hypothetical protein
MDMSVHLSVTSLYDVFTSMSVIYDNPEHRFYSHILLWILNDKKYMAITFVNVVWK